MKKIIIIFGAILFTSFILTSCGESEKETKERLEALVLNDLKSNFDQTIGNGGATYSINSFSLVKVSDVEYSGIMDFIFNEQESQLKVKVIHDGDTYQWEILK